MNEVLLEADRLEQLGNPLGHVLRHAKLSEVDNSNGWGDRGDGGGYGDGSGNGAGDGYIQHIQRGYGNGDGYKVAGGDTWGDGNGDGNGNGNGVGVGLII